MPAPRREYAIYTDDGDVAGAAPPKPAKVIPPYGARRGFVPRSREDFGDGGAFPEIHVKQYPLDMGRKKQRGSTVSAGVDAEGNVRYDSAVRAQHRGRSIVHSTFTDLVERDSASAGGVTDANSLARPSEDAEREAAARTAAALSKIVDGKVATAKPVNVPEGAAKRLDSTRLIRYTPSQGGSGHNSGAQQRIIKMVEAQVDPMEPPKFKHKKVPRGPGEAPVPVMHSPPRKTTVEDQQAWKIPPCISQWKNSKGYTIALDKRVGADGRGLQTVTVNDNFARMAQALHFAQREAREEVKLRNSVQSRLLAQEKEDKERELREAAMQARAARAGITGGATAAAGGDSDDGSGASDSGRSGSSHRRGRRGRSASRSRSRSASRSGTPDYGGRGRDDDAHAGESAAERQARIQRDRLRKERKRERERDMRLEAQGKRSKRQREEERDVGEKIALGMMRGGKPTGDAAYDSRLFNQSGGMDSGFGAEDEYNAYSKPLLGSRSEGIYRPRSGVDVYGSEKDLEKLRNTERFRPEKDFEGVDRSQPRAPGPVQFERASEAGGAGAGAGGGEGSDAFAAMGGGDVRGGGRALAGIGSKGHMAAAAGTRLDASMEGLRSGGSGRSKIRFTEGKN